MNPRDVFAALGAGEIDAEEAERRLAALITTSPPPGGESARTAPTPAARAAASPPGTPTPAADVAAFAAPVSGGRQAGPIVLRPPDAVARTRTTAPAAARVRLTDPADVPAIRPAGEPPDERVVRWHEVQPGVALVVMADREHKNTFSDALVSGLGAAFREIAADENLRVVVLTGYDRYFASGGTKEGLLAIQEGRVKFTDIDVYTLALDCELPVIAAMQGHAVGAGWAMGMFCDFVVFSADSYYASNYIEYGFTPGAGATQVFPERLGAELAREILFTGRRFRGAELAERGVPFPVVPRGEVLPTALARAGELARSPRAALIGLKNLLSVEVRERVSTTFDRELRMHEQTFVANAEVRERIDTRFLGAAPVDPPPPRTDRGEPVDGRAPSRPSWDTPIAVIGMAGRFPMADDVDAFWDNLAAGRDCVSEVPPSRWPVDAFFDEDPRTPGRTYSRWMGVLDGADSFDPLFFNISPAEAEQMDPQQRVFLSAAWHCIEDAAIAPSTLSDSRCGVFVGCGPGDYGQFLMDHGESAQGFTGAACSILSSRISYFLNLKGPCLAIDTSCSSSAVAIAEACDSLVLGTSDTALAGGVCVLSGPSTHLMTSRARMLSKDGRCRTFDDAADGFVPGEGVGVVLLKRLDDAVRDGDPIRGVIRGWGVNQDGRTNGITAPNGASQTRLEREVYERFGVDPNTITMVEAHGTATRLGDPIEFDALVDAFRGHTDRTGYCALGSVKSNIGHLLSAAGVAGVIKVLLSLRHRMIPPTINVSRVNEHIRTDGTPFRVNTRLRPWEAPDGVPRRATVSSFGFSGTNAHLVFEEYEPAVEVGSPTAPTAPAVVVLSAQNEERLRRGAARLKELLEHSDGLDLADVAHTLQVGRDAMAFRLAAVVGSRAEAVDALAGYLAGADGACRTGHVRSRHPDPAVAAPAGAGPVEVAWHAVDEWLAGRAPDWCRLAGEAKPQRLNLPGYPFADERYWLPAFRDSFGTGTAVDERARPSAPVVENGVAPRQAATAAQAPVAPPHPVASARSTEQALDLLVGELSRLLRIPPSRLDADTAFADIGVDSLVVVRLVESLSEVLGDIPPETFFRHRTVGALADHLGREHRAARPRAQFAATSSPPAAPPWDAEPHHEPARRGDVAVIGVSGRYPKADTLAEFWTNLEFARDCVVGIPPDRWSVDPAPVAGARKADGAYCRWGGFLTDVDRFDAPYFKVSPREAKFMDPQERLFLETAAACFQDAGYSRARLDDPGAADGRASVGVFVGATYNNYQLHQYAAGGGGPVNSQMFSIANRVSYSFNLRGPSMCVDTACSSSLLALHLAVESVRRGESAMALAGGVNLSLHPSKYLSLCAAQFLSSDGYCRTFGEGGDGYVPGEGVGAVLLKPLHLAEADGDHIHGVIRGTATNNDGRTFGYSVPNPAAQAEVVREALDRAGVDARTISYVEAHGTGTKLGDPIEISGLTEAFRHDTADVGFTAIGSVKANIGHLEAAAGIAALTKVLLQMRHRVLAASPTHTEQLNPAIDFASTPFRVQRVTGPWTRPVVSVDGRDTVVPRRAGISSFGAGGVNVHVIVEEHQPPVSAPADGGPVVIALSAREPDRLTAAASALREHLASTVFPPSPADLAHTLLRGRDEHPSRLAFVARSRDEVLRGLDAFLTGATAGTPTPHTGAVEPTGEPPAPPEPGAGLEELVAAWVRGARVVLPDPPGARTTPLPTYPFAGGRYWPGSPVNGVVPEPRPTTDQVLRPVQVDDRPTVSTSAGGRTPITTRTGGDTHRSVPVPGGRTAEDLSGRVRPERPPTRVPAASPLLRALADVVVDERAEVLGRFLQERVAELLEYPSEELPDSRQGFFDLGMESVMVEKFRRAIEGELDIEVADTAIFDHPTVEDLTAHLLDLVAWDALDGQVPIEQVPVPSPPVGPVPAGAGAHTGSGLTRVATELRELLVRLGEIS
ncbi:polyketide synthase [Actinokineospora sp. PR83]|uniref:beta-ketoacyl synthase N-terminal-like domain-containing protein n=1 Tax=Actinokineospora sp. PR83 TaxID=2884908 RepID=UPI0027DF93AC|nr:beta-ketoacyl synthase N-terminal-like domain-containing protein [Actinokineospora sp. PR83]MCG8915260.1 polyketide synthase [Actinokineospora sp. PR83]